MSTTDRRARPPRRVSAILHGMSPRARRSPSPAAPIADPLTRAFQAILAEARSHVAARRGPDEKTLTARLRAAAARRADELGGDEEGEIAAAHAQALDELGRILAVDRAYRRVATEPAPVIPRRAQPAPATPRRLAGLKSKPTVSGNLEVRRTIGRGSLRLDWDPVPAVRSWELRIGTRPDPRADYELSEPTVLADGVTEIEAPLGDDPIRVSILGKARDGRPVRRLLISALTAENASDRWERRATAS
jgi:hypothetical protein